jgi:4-aminobutyrate aminotransferase-like enzyme
VLLARRQDRIAPSLSVSYRKPLTIVRGKGAWLYDPDGRGYLDLVNNVAHVGHCHPHVTDAIARQAGMLNTNARYLHKNLLDYADRITATMPPELSVCIFTCSGSEANDLAIRMARTATGRFDAVVLDMAYHGHTTALIDISPYKFARKGGQGCKPFVHVAPMPDPYRGVHRGTGEEVGRAYAAEVAAAVARSETGPAFFIAESYLGVGGQVIMPPEFLKGAYAAVRAAGGLCIADEVQVGFGRPGHAMWAFEDQGAVPDIVTLGKPIGAGHPMAAVVTTPAIARAFANGMEYFNTFGGNPVSCAAGMAVLDVIENEDLMARARDVGGFMLDGLHELSARHELIGDVRGRGLFIGIELVEDRAARTPAGAAASEVVQQMRHRGILLSTDGPDENVIKIKPPMVLSRQDAGLFLETLDEVLGSIGG